MDESDPLHTAFEDGFGARVSDADPASGERLERLYVSDTFKTVVEQLRERTGRLTNLRHIRFVRLRSIERERDHDKRLYVLADATPGIRLARVLHLTQLMGLTVDVDTVIHVLRELLPALALLHDSRSVTHGAVGPERLLVTDKGRVVVGDHMFGSALDKLRLSRARLWQDLRVPMPPAAGVPRFDKRSDVSQVGMVALSMLLGRPLRDEEFPTRIPSLLDSLTETHRSGHTERLSKELRAWLERALPIDARKPFLATKEAQTSLEDVVAGRKAYSPSSAALKAFVAKFLAEFSRRAPAPAETVAPSSAVPDSVPSAVVLPVDAPLPATADLLADEAVPPTQPLVSDVAGEIGAESERASEASEGQPVPQQEAPPTAQKLAVAESAPKRRGGSKKKPPAQAWHPSIDETEAEEILRLEAELSRLAALEADGSTVTVGAAAVSGAESDAEQVIDLDCALDLLAEEAVPGNEDGAWVLEASSALADVGAALSEPPAKVSEPDADLEPSLELTLDLDDAFAFESKFGEVLPTVGPPQLIDRPLNAESSGVLVVEHFGIAPVRIESGEPEPDGHALAPVSPATVVEPVALVEPVVIDEPVALDEPVVIDEPVALVEPVALDEPVLLDEPVVLLEPVALDESVVKSSPAALVPDRPVEVGAAAGEAVWDTDVSHRAEPVDALGEDAVDEAVPIEPEGDDVDRFELTPPGAMAVPDSAAALVGTERMPQAELDFDCEPVECEESVDDGFVLVAWTPPALDSDTSAAGEGDGLVPLVLDDVSLRLPFESADVVSDDPPDAMEEPSVPEGPSVPRVSAVEQCPAPDTLAQPVSELGEPACEEWLATGTDGPAEHSFDGPLAFDAVGRARSRSLERDLGGFDQPSVWSVPPRWRALEMKPRGPNSLEDFGRLADSPDGVAPEEPIASLPSAGAFDASPVEALASPTAADEEYGLDADIGSATVDAPQAGLDPVDSADGPPSAEIDTGHEPSLEAEPSRHADAHAPLDLLTDEVQPRPITEIAPVESEQPAAMDVDALPALPSAVAIETEHMSDSIHSIEHAGDVECERAPELPSALAIALEAAPPPEATVPIVLAPAPAVEPAPSIAVATEPESGALRSTVGESEPACEPAPPRETAPTVPIEIAADEVPEHALISEVASSETVSSTASASLSAAVEFAPSTEVESEVGPGPETDQRFGLASEPTSEGGPAHAPRAQSESEAVREGASDARAEAVPEAEPVSHAGNADLVEADESVDEPVGEDESDASAATETTVDASAAAAPTARGSKRSRRRKRKASGESLMRRSSFAPVRIERPPMPAPPWLRGKAAAVPGEGEAKTPDMSAPPASTSSAPASSSSSSRATQVSSASAPSFGPPVTTQGAAPLPDYMASGAGRAEVHMPVDSASPAPIALQVEHQGAGLGPALHASPTRAVSSRPALSVGRLAALVLVGLLVEAVVLGGWALMSRPDTTGRLLIVTRPKGIRVIVDGTVVGDTPYAAPVAPGKHAIQLTGRSITRTLEVDVPPSAQGGAFVRWPTEAARGSVTISSVPDGARVSIDGEEMGTAPVTVHDLIVGTHSVTVTGKRGSVETTVEVKADRTASLEVPIYSGWVSVFSAVPLDITENGKLLGNTESDRIMLGAGAHTLEVVNVSLGYRESRTVQVVPGKVVPVSVELPTAPLFIDVEPGVEIWVDGERVGYTPAMDLRAPIGTRVILLKREGQPDERHVVSVRLPGPTRVGPAQP